MAALRSSRLAVVLPILLALCLSDLAVVNAAQPAGGRLLFLTLVPNFENETIEFDGQSVLAAASDPLDLDGLPLQVDRQWQEPLNPIWNISGTVAGGRLEYEPDRQIYHLRLGPILLRPGDELKLVLPFVNLEYDRIEPAPDPPDDSDLRSREQTQRFTFRGGPDGYEIQTLDIPFTTISQEIDLTLMPLVGEALIPSKQGFRFSGQVRFSALTDFAEFSRHCQSTASRILHGSDYRAAHLMYTLDFPHYFGPDVLNAVHQHKPTILGLRSKLTTCQFDREEQVGLVEAVFSGRTDANEPDPVLYPTDWLAANFSDRNAPFVPSRRYTGVSGFEIRFGRISLAPGDRLTLTVPHTDLQVDSLGRVPDVLVLPQAEDGAAQTQIVYLGPAVFELSIPYVARSGLYAGQFPAFLRPVFSLVERPLRPLFPVQGARPTWAVLGVGLFLLALSFFSPAARWLALPGWLLSAVGLFYGLQGSFGLLFLAVVLYLRAALPNTAQSLGRLLSGLGALVLIAFGIRLDAEGTTIFQGLSEPELSPLTPLVLLLVAAGLFVLLYTRPGPPLAFSFADLPALALGLSVLALYDAFDKSLLALLVLLGGLWYVTRQSRRAHAPGSEDPNEFREALLARMWLVFGNRIVPLALVVMIVFAIVNDLSSTYANEMQIRIEPLITPLVVPLLAFSSVFVAFTSIAGLFVLVYPYLPGGAGYLKAVAFALFLFIVFLFGVGTDDRLITLLPGILTGRVIYYFSVPLLIGLYLDIDSFMQNENRRLAAEGGEKKRLSFRTAGGMYLKNLQSLLGTIMGVASLVLPTIFAFTSSQPVLVTYFDLLEKLVLLPL
jgi:hypothetical protein